MPFSSFNSLSFHIHTVNIVLEISSITYKDIGIMLEKSE